MNCKSSMYAIVIGLWLLGAMASTQADEDRGIDEILTPIPLTDRVFYFYGSLEGRSPLNLGMNNNTGFVVTDQGVILIDSGPNAVVAQGITEAVATVTDQPITHVINQGSQDHRWLGNDWFVQQGAQIVALQRTVDTQLQHANAHMTRLQRVLGAEFMASTHPVVAQEPIAEDHYRLEIGGVVLELLYVANGHFPGDILIHLPDEGVLFAGDVLYTERMVGIHPWSDPEGKISNLETVLELAPALVVPGHGAATDPATAWASSGHYLQRLVAEVKAGIADWETLDETVERLADWPEFQDLLHYEPWHRTNVHQTYLLLE